MTMDLVFVSILETFLYMYFLIQNRTDRLRPVGPPTLPSGAEFRLYYLLFCFVSFSYVAFKGAIKYTLLTATLSNQVLS